MTSSAAAVDKISGLVSGSEIGWQLPHYCQLWCSSNKKKKKKGSGGEMIVWKNGSHESAVCWSSAQQSAIKINLLTLRSVKCWEIKLKVCDFIKTFGHFWSIKCESVCISYPWKQPANLPASRTSVTKQFNNVYLGGNTKISKQHKFITNLTLDDQVIFTFPQLTDQIFSIIYYL